MSALVVYALITVICGILLFVMAVFGADSDVDADVDVDADFDVDAGMDLDAADMDVVEFGGPSRLSLKLILFFLIGFGAIGYVSAYLKWPVHHVMWGLGGGAVAWYIGYAILKILYKQQSSSQVRAASFVGEQAKVTVPIPKAGVGEISAASEKTGQSIYLSARAGDAEKEFKKGDVVTIKSVTGGTATVE
jgi:membrane protein implicated in regulation of membrane protease activity